MDADRSQEVIGNFQLETSPCVHSHAFTPFYWLETTEHRCLLSPNGQLRFVRLEPSNACCTYFQARAAVLQRELGFPQFSLRQL